MPLLSLPDGFEGVWQGIPYASVIGPWSHNFTFSIAKNVEGDYLFEANLPFDASPDDWRFWSWQRSYLKSSGENQGSLLHCPGPRSPRMERVAMMQAHRINDKQLTFCLKKWPGYVDLEHPFPFLSLSCYTDGDLPGCGCFNWTLRLDGSRLDYEVSMGASPGDLHSKHMRVALERLPDSPAREDLAFPGEGTASFDCDYHSRDEHQTPLASCPFALQYQMPIPKTLGRQSSFQHCYVLDQRTDLSIEWFLNLQSLHVKISATALYGSKSYVAIGFRPLGGASTALARELGTGREQRFGMRGADIVLGHAEGVSRFYASSYSGAPEPDESLEISAETVSHANGRISLEFVRPLVGGRLHALHGLSASIASDLADMMWAVGQWNNEEHFPQYHGFVRGWREINWTDPEYDERPLLSLRPYKCVQGVVYP